MPKTVSFFDFDQTSTNKHTFKLFRKENYTKTRSQHDIYIDGQTNALNNMKKNIASYLKHDEYHLSAVVSFHNNPAFIAGFVSKIMGRALTFITTRVINARVTMAPPSIAVDYYSVEGMDAPFLISYIRADNEQYSKTINEVIRKNNQINMLRDLLMLEKLIEKDTVIHYYDDDQKNIEQAKTLPFIDRYLISTTDEQFTIKHVFLSEHTKQQQQIADAHFDRRCDERHRKPCNKANVLREPQRGNRRDFDEMGQSGGDYPPEVPNTTIDGGSAASLNSISSDFFMEIIIDTYNYFNPKTTVVGLLVVIASIAAVTVSNTSGIVATVIFGASMAGLGAGLGMLGLSRGFFSRGKTSENVEDDRASTRLQPI